MKSVIVDANLLLLLVVGSADTKYIGKFDRLSAYEAYHFDILIAFLKGYSDIVVTPHSLTEVWNLIGEKKGIWDTRNDEYSECIFQLLAKAVEIHTPASDLVKSKLVRYLGLSDVAQIDAARLNNGLLFSADGVLCQAAQREGVEAQCFWHLDNML